jgi:hypothetical protein
VTTVALPPAHTTSSVEYAACCEKAGLLPYATLTVSLAEKASPATLEPIKVRRDRPSALEKLALSSPPLYAAVQPSDLDVNTQENTPGAAEMPAAVPAPTTAWLPIILAPPIENATQPDVATSSVAETITGAAASRRPPPAAATGIQLNVPSPFKTVTEDWPASVGESVEGCCVGDPVVGSSVGELVGLSVTGAGVGAPLAVGPVGLVGRRVGTPVVGAPVVGTPVGGALESTAIGCENPRAL